jgi:hypothetical protein
MIIEWVVLFLGLVTYWLGCSIVREERGPGISLIVLGLVVACTAVLGMLV